MSGKDFIANLRKAFTPEIMPIMKLQMSRWGGGGTDDKLCEHTIFGKALHSMGGDASQEAIDGAIADYAAKDAVADAAMGAMVGQAIGDAVGAPLEFLDVDESPYPKNMEEAKAVMQRKTERESFLFPELNAEKKTLQYFNVCNKFRLKPGQWTDDASMALCLADNMIVNGKYEGGDCRARYFNWWFHGYNNAFRCDKHREFGRTSVGLGGNISKSLEALIPFVGKGSTDISARYEAQGEDAGNGSIMRLSPVPVRYHSNPIEAMEAAAESSYATHPGPDAAACCKFIAYFVTQAMHRDRTSTIPLSTYIDQIIADFSKLVDDKTIETDSGIQKLMTLLASEPSASTEQCWNWRVDGPLEVNKTLEARGRRYNGYPVIPGYFGSYCMDGLAMSLWSMKQSNNFSETMLNVVNLLGDCDTTAAICGQMVGSFYGYQQMQADPLGQHFMDTLHRWDPERQWELRALYLYEDGCNAKSQVL